MQGTVPAKIGRVLVNLIQHPQYISRCLAHNVVNGKTPLDLEVPWFSYAAIDFLETFLQPNMNVCEYGSGGSTVFFRRPLSTHEAFRFVSTLRSFNVRLVPRRCNKVRHGESL